MDLHLARTGKMRNKCSVPRKFPRFFAHLPALFTKKTEFHNLCTLVGKSFHTCARICFLCCGQSQYHNHTERTLCPLGRQEFTNWKLIMHAAKPWVRWVCLALWAPPGYPVARVDHPQLAITVTPPQARPVPLHHRPLQPVRCRQHQLNGKLHPDPHRKRCGR